ncbi:hypothetical protein K1719_026435 [Acacia pycnantha]|nr:hypothetical protein K1719_026435 [Acacia pycnantha]
MEEVNDDAESMEEEKGIEKSDHERDGNLRIQSGLSDQECVIQEDGSPNPSKRIQMDHSNSGSSKVVRFIFSSPFLQFPFSSFITPISRLGGVNVQRSSLSASSMLVHHLSSPSS